MPSGSAFDLYSRRARSSGNRAIEFRRLQDAISPSALRPPSTELFAWEINSNNALSYRMVDAGSEARNQRRHLAGAAGMPSMVSLYVEVDDVAAFAARAANLGGKIVIPPQKLPDGDEMAVILDVEGIPVGLFKAARD